MCSLMARGGLSFDGIGIKQATYVAGENLKALAEANGRDAMVGVPVVVVDNGTVDLGENGQVVDGIINVYEDDGHVGVTFRGYVTNVPIVKSSTTVKGIVAVNGNGKAKDLPPITIGTETLDLKGFIRVPTFHEIDLENETATVFLG